LAKQARTTEEFLMTKIQMCSLTFVPAQSRRGSSLEKLSLATMVCAVFLFCAAAVIASPAQSILFRSLTGFNGTNGANPGNMSLVQGADGNFYGTTLFGGANNQGTVFKVTPAGELSTLYSFCAQTNCTDGSLPDAGLVLGHDGNFYGTTSGGGSYLYYGTVFKITATGSLTTLHSFQSYPTDGDAPVAALVEGSDGNFYGTTELGGSGTFGTVFKITPSGTLTTLYNFSDNAKGWYPYAGLVQGSDGNFYGTTFSGGASSDYCGYPGCGTVFKITAAGALTTLYSFCAQPGCADGSGPWAGLVQGNDGNLYGTTYNGGAGADGTVFKLTLTGELTTLYSFCVQNGCLDGEQPLAALVQAADGNFYGTTSYGGAYGSDYGTVFGITPQGTLTTLHSFAGTDGSSPWGGLVQAPNRVCLRNNQCWRDWQWWHGLPVARGSLLRNVRFPSRRWDRSWPSRKPPSGQGNASLVFRFDGNEYNPSAVLADSKV
jgi:uncharacterized repeat protein (TIGR03803 family)